LSSLKERIRRCWPGDIAWQCPLAGFTTLKVGGPADALIQPQGLAALSQLVACLTAEEIPWQVIGRGSKVNHLSYIGDTVMGSACNVGAGTITCNYDGANKFTTEIGNNVFIGSDTQLVAPVKVADDATIGAGSTITRNVAAGGLTLSERNPQKYAAGWKRPQKDRS